MAVSFYGEKNKKDYQLIIQKRKKQRSIWSSDSTWLSPWWRDWSGLFSAQLIIKQSNRRLWTLMGQTIWALLKHKNTKQSCAFQKKTYHFLVSFMPPPCVTKTAFLFLTHINTQTKNVVPPLLPRWNVLDHCPAGGPSMTVSGWGKTVLVKDFKLQDPVHWSLNTMKSSCTLSMETASNHNVSTSVHSEDGVLVLARVFFFLQTHQLTLVPKSWTWVSSDCRTFSQTFKSSRSNWRQVCPCVHVSSSSGRPSVHHYIAWYQWCNGGVMGGNGNP